MDLASEVARTEPTRPDPDKPKRDERPTAPVPEWFDSNPKNWENFRVKFIAYMLSRLR
jgi:hypothetical protein